MGRAPFAYLEGQARARRSRQILKNRPIEWLEHHKSGNLLPHWAGPLAVACLFVFWPADPLGSLPAREGFVAFVLCQLAIRIWVAAHAAYAFTADRRSGALESLLGTQVDVPEIAAGMFRGFFRRFSGPIAVSTVLGLTLAIRLAWRASGESAFVMLLVTVMAPWDYFCLFWIGLFQGLAARSPAIGFAATVLRVVVLPWAWLLIIIQLLTQSTRPLSQFPLVQLLILGILIVLVNHSIFLVNARASLRSYFRLLALKPFGEKPPHIESAWSPISWEEEPDASP